MRWRDNLCASDTLGMTVAVVYSGTALLSAGRLGVCYEALQRALCSQERQAIKSAQSGIEELLPDIVQGHVAGDFVGVADLWAG